MNILVISCSLNAASRSHRLASLAVEHVQKAGAFCRMVDLREYPLPLCDAGTSYDDPRVAELEGMIREADAVLLAVPIYNYDVNAAAKNLIELTGDAWENKIVGFMCAAGGHSSYMSVMSLANSLMLDFRCLVVPRFVYATKGDFVADASGGTSGGGGGGVNETIGRRVEELAAATLRISAALRPRDDDEDASTSTSLTATS